MTRKASWELESGDEITPGLAALQRLGGGRRYEAYLAWSDDLHSQVVVKIVRPDQTEDDRALRELRREVDALSRLAHPMLVRSFGSVLEGPRPHVVLEHFEGPTLRRLLKDYGPLPLEQLVPLAVQTAGALHYLSKAETVHLDVKPGNIIMEAPPKLIDLSVARTFEVAAKLTGTVGTKAYMAPEQCDPAKLGPPGPQSDVWGLGATLFEAVTGTKAFTAPDDARAEDSGPAADYPQLNTEHRPWPDDVPAAIAASIDACLQRNPAARPSAADVAATFEPLLRKVAERPRSRRGRPRTPPRR